MPRKPQTTDEPIEIELVADDMVPEKPVEQEIEEVSSDESAVETVEREAPAHDEVMVPIEAAPDGSEMKLVSGSFVVRARESFHDIETKRDYKAGDVVENWSRERAEKYALRGLVAIEE